jgi:mono/diheme cytochrome c family protein
MNWKIAGVAILGGLLGCVLVGQNSLPDRREKRRLVDPLEGQALYGNYCAVCHGDDGKGGGPMAKVLRSAPPDLTHIWMRNGGKFPLERVRKIISGETEVGSHGTREMPLWGPIFAQNAWDQDIGQTRILNLARYLEKIQAN